MGLACTCICKYIPSEVLSNKRPPTYPGQLSHGVLPHSLALASICLRVHICLSVIICNPLGRCLSLLLVLL